MSIVFNDQDKEFDNIKLTNSDSSTVNRDPTTDNEVSNKKYIDIELDENTILRFNQTLQNYLKVSIGDDVYNLSNFVKKQITNFSILSSPNTGGILLQQWNIKCNDENNNGKITNFIKSTKQIVQLETQELRTYLLLGIVSCI